MKHIILGTFTSKVAAEKLAKYFYQELKMPTEDISSMYRNAEGEVWEVDGYDLIIEGAPSGRPSVGARTGVLKRGVEKTLVGFGVPEPKAKEYEKCIWGGDVLLIAYSEDENDTLAEFTSHGAALVHTYPRAM